MKRPRALDCLYCIDGNMPAGTHDILHEVYQPCPHCLHVCWLRKGEGLFPADYDCFGCLTARLAALGLAPVVCLRCCGVVDLIPHNSTQEVTCHAHHHN